MNSDEQIPEHVTAAPRFSPGKRLGVLLLLLLLFAGSTALALPSLLQMRLMEKLTGAGFTKATIGKIEMSAFRTVIDNVALNAGRQQGVNRIEIYYTPFSLLSGTVERIFIDEINLTVASTDNGGYRIAGATAGGDDTAFLSPADIPADNIELRSANITLDIGDEPLTVNLAGRMEKSEDGSATLRGRLTGRTPDIRLKGRVEADAPVNGPVKAALTIEEATLDHADIKSRRLTGWINTTLGLQGETQELSAEIAAAQLEAAGLPLQGVTLTYDSQAGSHHFIARGQVRGKAGDFLIDLDIHPENDSLFGIKGLADINMRDLSVLSGLYPDIGGEGYLKLDFTGSTAVLPLPGTLPQWQQLSGRIEAGLNQFSMPGKVTDFDGKAQYTISRTSDGMFLLSAQNALEIQGRLEDNLLAPFSPDGSFFLTATAPDENTPHSITIGTPDKDGLTQVSMGGHYEMTAGNGNHLSFQGRQLTLGITPEHEILSVSAEDISLQGRLTADLPELKLENTLFDFQGALDAGRQNLVLRPSQCLLLKAEKISSAALTLNAPLDACFAPLADGPLLDLAFGGKKNAVHMNFGLEETPLDVSLPQNEQPLRLSGRTPGLELRLSWNEADGLENLSGLFSGGGALALSPHPYSLSGIDGRLGFDPMHKDPAERMKVKLGAKVSQLSKPKLFAPFIADLTANGNPEDRFSFELSLSDPNGSFVTEVTGKYAMQDHSGDAKVTLYPATFIPGGYGPTHYLPVLSRYIDSASGTISVDGRISWRHLDRDSRDIDGRLEAELKNVALTAHGYKLEGLNARLIADDVYPLSLPTGQTVEIAYGEAGLPIQNALILFSMTGDRILDVAHFKWEMAGGQMEIRPFATALENLNRLVEVEARDIDLASLVTMADIEGLNASGKLAGTIPVRITPKGFTVEQGTLAAIGTGSIRYNPESYPAALGSANKNIENVRTALKNLTFEELSLKIHESDTDNQSVLVHIRGNNPEFFDGFPVELNLNLEGALTSLLGRNMGAIDFNDLPKEAIHEN